MRHEGIFIRVGELVAERVSGELQFVSNGEEVRLTQCENPVQSPVQAGREWLWLLRFPVDGPLQVNRHLYGPLEFAGVEIDENAHPGQRRSLHWCAGALESLQLLVTGVVNCFHLRGRTRDRTGPVSGRKPSL